MAEKAVEKIEQPTTPPRKASAGEVRMATPWIIDKFQVGDLVVTPKEATFSKEDAEKIREAVKSMHGWKLRVDESVNEKKDEKDEKKEGGSN